MGLSVNPICLHMMYLEGERSSGPTGEPSEWDALSYVPPESSPSAGLTASLSEPPELVTVSVQVPSARPS